MFLEQAYRGHMEQLDRYIDTKTLLGFYKRSDCPLDDIDRELVIKHLIHGFTHQELGEEYKLTRQAVSQRINKALGILEEC